MASNDLEKAEIKKTCFVITPIGEDDSEIRLKTDGLIKSVLKPVLEIAGYKVITPHEISSPGSIPKQVIKNLLEADLVVANLTGLNSNVMYELAVRHAIRLPVVCVAEKKTVLPFDIASERIIFYEDNMKGVEDLKPKLNKFVNDAISESQPDNPIYRVLNDIIIRESAKSDEAQLIMISRLDEITFQINRIMQSIFNQDSTINRRKRIVLNVSRPNEKMNTERVISDLFDDIDMKRFGFATSQINESTIYIEINIVSQADTEVIIKKLSEKGYFLSGIKIL